MISDEELERAALLDSGIAGELARELREARKVVEAARAYSIYQHGGYRIGWLRIATENDPTDWYSCERCEAEFLEADNPELHKPGCEAFGLLDALTAYDEATK